MRSPAIDILETALALHRAPGERFRLRERPLPPGTIHLIEIAAGTPGSLRTAAEELGEPEELVLDASRFYLEQMLFADANADAYRVLGVSADTPTEDIRRHHRLLQRWLHPDRAQAGDAAVFSTRVNQAWSQLRAPESRLAYDARLADAVAAPGEAIDAPVRLWQGDAPEPAVGRRSRWLLATALAACAVLAVLMTRHQDEVHPWQETSAEALPPNVEAAKAAIEPQAPAPAEHGSALREALVRALEPALDVLPDVEPVELPPPPSPAAPMVEAPQIAASAAPTMRIAKVVMPPTPPIAVERSHAPLIAEHGSALQMPEPAPLHDANAALLTDRMRKAELRLGQVTAYLASSPDAAPLWNDAAIAEQAAQLRKRFTRQTGCPEVDGETWRLHRDNAHASAAWRCRNTRGRLDVELVWREGMWLVRGIDLAPAA